MFDFLGKQLSKMMFSTKPLSFELTVFRYVLSGLLFLLASLFLWLNWSIQEVHLDWPIMVATINGVIFWPTLRFSWMMQVVGGFLFFRTFG
jgi:hypothetical protein